MSFTLFTNDGKARPLKELTYGSDGKIRLHFRLLLVGMLFFAAVLIAINTGVRIERGDFGRSIAAEFFGFSFLAAWFWVFGCAAFKGRYPRWLEWLYEHTWGRLGF